MPDEINTLCVCQSNAGFYIGQWDEDGPASRESIYYPTREKADNALSTNTWIPKD